MDIVTEIHNRNKVFWVNPYRINSKKVLLKMKPGLSDIQEAEARLYRFAPLLVKLFPELNKFNGLIDSSLVAIPSMARDCGWLETGEQNNIFIKGDHELAISGSVKARGGFYAVYVIVEKILNEHGLDISVLVDKSMADIKSIIAGRSLVVGSTGNLGLSIGLMGRAFGFSVTVHMSADAKEWKKEKLRNIGVNVIEYESDYSEACRGARLSADEAKGVYFIDDENSLDLFLGYSTAAVMLFRQLNLENITIEKNHPLFVYIPCGVGGAPGGITFGLKHIYGDNVYCFFAEPVEAPAMLFGLVTGQNNSVSVKDIGINMETCADGLAVGRPSKLVAEIMAPILDGCFTIKDDEMLVYLSKLYDTESIKIEPSAAAGFSGPEFIINSKEGNDFLVKNNIDKNNITHVVWTTGGSMEPEEEFFKNYIK